MSSLVIRWKGAAWLLLAAFALAGNARADQVLLSKIMYHPPGELPEYVEIYNNTANAIDLADWRLKGGIEFRFPAFSAADPMASWMKPFERIVISMADARATRDAYKIAGNVRVLGPWIGRLHKQGDRLKLLDKNGLTVSTVKYLDHAPWPAAANGGGHALVLKNPDRKVDDWRNWTVSTKPGGAPGTESGSANEVPVGSPELVTQSGESVVVDYDATWSVIEGVDLTTTKWKELVYPAGNWRRGPGLIGFGTAKVPPPGLRSAARPGFVTYYMRHAFIYNGAPGGQISVDAIVDDGAVFYLNNQEIGRVGMPGGPVRANTPANRNVGDAIEEKSVFGVNPAALIRGTNILAVEVHQFPGQNPDLAFGIRLKVKTAGAALARTVLINEIFPGPAGINFIEFFNSGAQPVNLKGHFLLSAPPAPPTAKAAPVRRYQIQQDMVIRPKSFAILDMIDAGVWPKQPVVAYLVAPDGQTVLHAVSDVVPTDGRSLGQRPDGSGQWFHLAQPTPDAANAKQSGLVGTLKLNEVHLAKNGSIDWVEIYNAGTNRILLNGYFLSGKSGFADKVGLSGDLPPKAVKSFAVSFPTTAGVVPVFLVSPEQIVTDANLFHISKHGEFFQALPDGSGEWFVDKADTRNATNSAPARVTDIVINEIMYKPPDTQGKGEYVELFNRGTKTVNLGDWVLTGGIDFTFPPNTRLRAGGYIVVAADAGLIRSFHGAINVLGNFSGKLSNEGDQLRLLDEKGNLADEVDYKPGGDWPELAAGRGSSLELLHPDMDNRLSSAWAASDEANKSKPRTYTHRAVYTEQLTLGDPSDFRELHFFLNASGHSIISDVELRANGSGPNVLTNANRFSLNGKSDTGWLWQGNHWASRLEGDQLHIISEGHGDNRVNRVEIDTPGLTRSNLYELKFTARWVHGSHLLVAHTWDWSVAKVFQLDVPSNLGTPGKPNSRAINTPAAQAEDLAHYPAVPRSSDTVKITTRVASVNAPTVTLQHRAPDATGRVAWQSKPMFDNGTGGDDVAGDGLFTALLPEYKTDKQIVEFYVRAQSPGGTASLLPRKGPDLPALYIVDNQNVPRDLRSERFVISPFDLDALANGNTNKHNFRFPRLSNRYYNMTFINNERDIYYNCRVHPAGSSFTRDLTLNRAKWKIPTDRAFRGHTKLSWDNNSSNTRLARWMLYQIGHPVNESEMVRHLINGGPINMFEDVEPIGNDFLNRIFKDGTQGELYRTTYMFFYKDSGEGANMRNSTLAPNYGDDPINYKVVWSKRTREAEDDYTGLMDMLRTMSGSSYTEADVRRHFDLELTFKNWALRGYAKDSDTFSMGTSHNCFFFRKPGDGKFMCFLWDADFAFGGFDPKKQEGYWGGNVQNLMSKPWAQRLFYYYLVELLENYTKNSPRVIAYLKAEEEASNAYAVPAQQYHTFFAAREPHALAQMGDKYKLEFKVTTNAGQPLTTNALSLNIEGQAPFGIFTVVIDGQPRAKLEWLDDTKWRINNVGLSPGTNELELRGVDQWGNTKRSTKFTILKPAPPATKAAAK